MENCLLVLQTFYIHLPVIGNFFEGSLPSKIYFKQELTQMIVPFLEVADSVCKSIKCYVVVLNNNNGL